MTESEREHFPGSTSSRTQTPTRFTTCWASRSAEDPLRGGEQVGLHRRDDGAVPGGRGSVARRPRGGTPWPGISSSHGPRGVCFASSPGSWASLRWKCPRPWGGASRCSRRSACCRLRWWGWTRGGPAGRAAGDGGDAGRTTFWRTPPDSSPRSCMPLHMDQDRPIHVIMPYADRLRTLSLWFQQLWAESLGKAWTGRGRTVHTGPTPSRPWGPRTSTPSSSS
jgi:hypothetical protein